MTFECLLAGSHVRHDGVRQRQQHLLTRFAEHVPVLFVEETSYGANDRDVFVEDGPLSVLRPVRRSFDTPCLDERSLGAVRDWAGERKPLVWLSTPTMSALDEAFPAAPLVYDCVRDLMALAHVPLDLRVRERALVERADLVFAASLTLYDMFARYGEHVRLYPNGVEFAHFAQAQKLVQHPLLAQLTRPIAGCFGTIDERIDIKILRSLAERGGNVVLVGPIARIDPAVLPRRANVHFTGEIAYDELPSFLAGFDVAIVPFRHDIGKLELGVSPGMIPEYLAGGKPVVTTPSAVVEADWADVVTTAETPEAFVSACETAANQRDPVRAKARIERTRALDWDTIAAAMWTDILALAGEG